MRRKTARAALTLAELLLATALAAMLMAAVLAVVAQVGSEALAERADPAPQAALQAAAELIARDLAFAAEVRAAGDNSLALVTLNAWQHGEGRFADRPVAVRYAVETLGRAAWLVRRQGPLDEGEPEDWPPALVCRGVAAFVCVAQPSPDGAPPSAWRVSLRPVDASLQAVELQACRQDRDVR